MKTLTGIAVLALLALSAVLIGNAIVTGVAANISPVIPAVETDTRFNLVVSNSAGQWQVIDYNLTAADCIRLTTEYMADNDPDYSAFTCEVIVGYSNELLPTE